MVQPAGGRVGRAYVEITGDYDKFAREAETKINAALNRIQINDSTLQTRVAKVGANTGESFAKGIEDAIVNRFGAVSGRLGNSIASGVDSGANRSKLRNAFESLGRFAATGFGTAFGQLLSGAGSTALNALQQGGQALGKVFTSLAEGSGNFLIKAGLMVIILPHLAGVVFTLVANLTSLLGLLNAIPGLAGIAIGALLPLIIAFQNFGEGLTAILDGDPEKIAEAMKKLAPAARNVLKEVQALLPAFREIQKTTQQAFFSQTEGALTEVFNAIGSGRIATGFSNVADALGRFTATFIRLGSAPGVQRLAGLLFGDEANSGAISRILDTIGPPIQRMLDGLANAGASTIPTLEKVFERIGAWIDKFASFLNEQAANGEFDAFLKSALETAGDLKDLVFALLNLLITIFQNTDDGGERFLQKVTNAVDKLSAYFESPEGRQALEAMVTLAGAFANFLGVAAGALQTILTLLGAINSLSGGGPQGTVAGAVSAAAAKARAKGYAAGGVVTSPTFAMIGEAGAEAVVPLNDPQRAAEVMSEAGLVPLAENMMGGAGTLVQVFLGTKEITDILDTRVSRGLARAGTALARGSRQG